MADLIIPGAERLDTLASFGFTLPNEANPPKPLPCFTNAPGSILYTLPLPPALTFSCLPVRVTAPAALVLSASGVDANSAAFELGGKNGLGDPLSALGTLATGTKATVEASGHLTLRTVAAPLAGNVAVLFAADIGTVTAVPAMPPDANVVAEILGDGIWRLRRSWVVLSRLHCNLLHGYDFSGGAPETQTIGYNGSDLVYRSAAGTTWTLSP